MSNEKKHDEKDAYEVTIRINVSAYIEMHRATLNALNNPGNFHFWWSQTEKILAVKAADVPTKMSIPTPDYFYTNTGHAKLKNVRLRKAIKNLTGWPDSTRVTLTGKYIPEHKIIAFPVSSVITEVRGNE